MLRGRGIVHNYYLISISAGFLLIAGLLDAQQYNSFSQYSFNPFLINPAAAGSDGYTTIQLIARNQWIGIKDAPGTQVFNIQTRLYKGLHIPTSSSVRRKYNRPKRSGKVGLGFQAIHDKAGIFSRSGIRFSYAYHMKINRSQFSFGTALNICQVRIEKEDIVLEVPDEAYLNNSKLFTLIPDMDAGVFFSGRYYYSGFSVDNLTNAFGKLDLYQISSNRKRIYNILGGHKFELSDILIIEPSVLLQWTEFKTLQSDLTFGSNLYQHYWLAVTYRTTKAISIQAGVNINKLYIGYAYDHNFVALQKYCCGSHELMIALKLGDNARKYKWLDRY